MPNNLLIKWSDLHTTGIPIIDEQHHSVVGVINSLFFFMRNQQAAEIIAPTLVMLEQYTHIHFLTEESLLQRANYPEVEKHKKLHATFITKSQILSAQSRKTLNPEELLAFLKKWWTEHINGADHAYAPHVRKALQKIGKL